MLPTDKNVTVIAIIIPIIPNKLPCLDVSGDDNPLNAKMNNKTNTNPVEKLPVDKNVTVMAISIPKIPNKLPCLDVSGEDRPLNARINKTPETK